MFQPIELHAHNACQHRDVTLPFHPGITVVNGKNGSGKSNLTHVLLYFVLTGETPPKSGVTKKELVNWMSKSGYVTLLFLYNKQQYKITRNLHNSTVEVVTVGVEDSDGKPVKKKQAEANAFMEEVIGMPAQAFYKTCFAPQQKLTQVVQMTHGERMTYFQQLFGTEKAEKLRGLIKSYQDTLPNYPDRTEQVADCNTRITTLMDNMGGISTQLADRKQRLDGYNKTAPEWNQIMALPTEATRNQNIANCQTALNTVAHDKAAFAGTPVTEPVAVAAPDPQGQVMAQRLAQLNQLAEQQKVAQSTVQQWEQAEVPLPGDAPAQGATPTDEGVAKMTATLATMGALYKLAKEGVCPTCQREHTLDVPPAQVIAEYDAFSKEVIDARQVHRQACIDVDNVYRQALNVWQTTNNARTSWESSLKAAWDSLNGINASLETYADARAFDKPAWEASVTAYNAYAAKLTEYQTYLTTAQAFVDREAHAQAALTQANAAAYVENAVFTQGQTFRAEHQQVQQEVSTLEANWAAANAELQAEQKRQVEYMVEQEKRSQVINTVEKFEAARTLLHKDNLQRLVMAKALGSLNMIMDEYLGHFGKDYTAWIDETFDFRASKPDNSDFRAGLLSGGEKMALCMAYMLAIAEVKGSNIPIMVLDEPTDGLDAEAMNGLIEVLKIARSYAEKGLYILIPSHAPEMEAAKSQVISMEDISS